MSPLAAALRTYLKHTAHLTDSVMVTVRNGEGWVVQVGQFRVDALFTKDGAPRAHLRTWLEALPTNSARYEVEAVQRRTALG